jgi:hypothetical protein
VPFSSVVPVTFSLPSSSPSLITGNVSVDQITVDAAPGRRDETFLTNSSILTTARPDASWPVTTRRIFRLIERFPSFVRIEIKCGLCAKSRERYSVDVIAAKADDRVE